MYPIAHRQVIVHMPPAVLFHDGLFLTHVGVNDRGIFRIGGIGVRLTICSSMLVALFAVFVDYHTLLQSAGDKQQQKYTTNGREYVVDYRCLSLLTEVGEI